MAVEAHINQLKEKHLALEKEIEKMQNQPSVSEADINILKREKLYIKDKIADLRR